MLTEVRYRYLLALRDKDGAIKLATAAVGYVEALLPGSKWIDAVSSAMTALQLLATQIDADIVEIDRDDDVWAKYLAVAGQTGEHILSLLERLGSGHSEEVARDATMKVPVKPRPPIRMPRALQTA